MKIFFKKNLHINKKSKILLLGKCHLDFETKRALWNIAGNFIVRDNLRIRVCNDGVLSFGNNVFINNDCSITCRNRITIGNDCIIGENVKIYDHNHNYKTLEIPISKQGFSDGFVEIGNNVWIGSNVVILKDVIIGDNCVIGAGCVVYKNIPENSIMYSNGRVDAIK